MTEARRPEGVERAGANWPKAAEGIQLAGFAVFLLLNTTGVLPWSFWLDAIALWPLLDHVGGHQDRLREDRAPAGSSSSAPRSSSAGSRGSRAARRPEAPAGPWEAEVASRPEGDAARGPRGRSSWAPACASPPRRDLPAGPPRGRPLDRRAATARASRRHGRDGLARVRLRRRREARGRVPAPPPGALGPAAAGRAAAPRCGSRARAWAATSTSPPARSRALQTEGVFIGVDARLPAPRRGHRDPDERRLQLAQPVRARGDAGPRARPRPSLQRGGPGRARAPRAARATT